MSFCIRRLKHSDVEQIVTLFYETVHAINAQDYTQEQLNAWAPTLSDAERRERVERMRASLARNVCFVACGDGLVVGFADISNDGYLDHLYVHKDHQRRGIASRLLRFVEDAARNNGVAVVRTNASITAKPLFERHGYVVVRVQEVMVRGVSMSNFQMTKSLNS